MMKNYYVYILSNNSKTLYIVETIRELALSRKINLIESKNSDRNDLSNKFKFQDAEMS